MLDPKQLDDFINQVLDALPEGFKALPEELKSNLKVALQGTLERFDLVTREEFDAQVAVLRRTRGKLDAIEAKLDALEKGHGAPAASKPKPKGATTASKKASTPDKTAAPPSSKASSPSRKSTKAKKQSD